MKKNEKWWKERNGLMKEGKWMEMNKSEGNDENGNDNKENMSKRKKEIIGRNDEMKWLVIIIM